jgi:hypothetical protein
LGYEPFVNSWLASITNQDEQDLVRALFDKYAAPCIAWVLEGAEGDELVKRPQQSIPITNLNMMKQLTTLLDALTNGHYGDSQVPLCSVVDQRQCISWPPLKQMWHARAPHYLVTHSQHVTVRL